MTQKKDVSFVCKSMGATAFSTPSPSNLTLANSSQRAGGLDQDRKWHFRGRPRNCAALRNQIFTAWCRLTALLKTALPKQAIAS
jgi:hypothetical protein